MHLPNYKVIGYGSSLLKLHKLLYYINFERSSLVKVYLNPIALIYAILARLSSIGLKSLDGKGGAQPHDIQSVIGNHTYPSCRLVLLLPKLLMVRLKSEH